MKFEVSKIFNLSIDSTEVPEDEARQVEEDAGHVERHDLVAVLPLEGPESLEDHGHHHDPVHRLEDEGVGDHEVDGQEGEAVGEQEDRDGTTDCPGLLSHLGGNVRDSLLYFSTTGIGFS